MKTRRIGPHGPAGLTFAIGVLALGGCEQVKRVDDPNDGGAIPTAVQEAFDRQCNLAGCHDSAGNQQGLVLEASASASIIGRMAQQSPLPLVELGNVPGSYLAIKILPDSALMELDITRTMLRMPNVPITPEIQEDVAIILGWIAGAELPGGAEGGTDDTGTGSESTTAGTTGDVELLCGIDDLNPGSTNPIVAGDGAMQIPTEIGNVLATNCGCHYIDMLNRPVPDYFQGTEAHAMAIDTWANWRLPYGPMAKSPIDESLARLDPASLLPMPPPASCSVSGANIAADDKALLVDWLMQEAPDGASWMGGGDSSGGGSTSGGSTGEATGGSSTG